ncbi:MAG: hypothetical protein GX819_02870 [Clostridiaceae bacterium]|nr:hypothetical protein [Clostridiaceae bacterium]
MEGIDRIRRHILAEAESEVEALAAETKVLVDQEISNAEKECGKIIEEARERAQQEAELIVKRGEGVAEALLRKQELERKQALADQIILRALRLLQEKAAPERVRLYAGWIRSLDLEEGVITLSAADRIELGEDLLEALPRGRFSIDGQDGDFTGGSAVTHGRVRDNLTYDVVVRDYRAELARAALDLLGMGGAGEGRDG